MNLALIGDVHGCFNAYNEVIKTCERSIQLGDFGIGFWWGDKCTYWEPDDTSAHKFIRGNHDNPGVCQMHPGFLGDWGYLEDDGIFFISGAHSIDGAGREVGKEYWPESEEVTWKQAMDLSSSYHKVQPRIVISHDGPLNILIQMNIWYRGGSRTVQLLDSLFDYHKPELWVFAHHHRTWSQTILGTKFICLNELEVFDLDEY